MNQFLITISLLFLSNFTIAQTKTIEEVRKELKVAKAKFKGKKPKYYFRKNFNTI